MTDQEKHAQMRSEMGVAVEKGQEGSPLSDAEWKLWRQHVEERDRPKGNVQRQPSPPASGPQLPGESFTAYNARVACESNEALARRIYTDLGMPVPDDCVVRPQDYAKWRKEQDWAKNGRRPA